MHERIAQKKIRVLCVDDHRIVRDGIALIIARQPDMTVVGSAATGEEAIEQFRIHQPDITLMDLRLGPMSGIEAIATIRREFPAARIIVLTMYQGDEDIHQALTAGAVTYLLKDSLSDDLIRTVRKVHKGERPIAAELQARLRSRDEQPKLTARETEVMRLIAQGKRNKEIAVALDISEETVPVHVKKIFAKLNVSERTSAVKVAVSRGIVHMDD